MEGNLLIIENKEKRPRRMLRHSKTKKDNEMENLMFEIEAQFDKQFDQKVSKFKKPLKQIKSKSTKRKKEGKK